MESITCVICGATLPLTEDARDSMDSFVCQACFRRVPPSLLKACFDPFDYALGLTNGAVIEFHEAEIHGDWVTITGRSDEHGDCPFDKKVFGHYFPRGLDVRLDAICWCADAPDGS